MDTDTLFFRTREEMGHMFRDLPEALRATMDVADQTELELEFGTYHPPHRPSVRVTRRARRHREVDRRSLAVAVTVLIDPTRAWIRRKLVE